MERCESELIALRLASSRESALYFYIAPLGKG